MRKTPSSHSPGHTNAPSGVVSPDSKGTESPRKVVASEDNVHSGFSVGSPHVGENSSLEPSPLAEETSQNRDHRDGFEEDRGEPPLNNEESELAEAEENSRFTSSEPSSESKHCTEENRRHSETEADDLSPWKKPKPSNLPIHVHVPPKKPSLNPFDDVEDDDQLQKAHGVHGSAQAQSNSDGIHNGLSQQERKSHDKEKESYQIPTVGKNPFDEDIGKNPFEDDFEYGYEEPNLTEEIPGMLQVVIMPLMIFMFTIYYSFDSAEQQLGRARSGAISDAFIRRSSDLVLSPMLESPGAETSMSVPAQYHLHEYMAKSRSRERDGGSSRDLESLLHERSKHLDEKHPSKTLTITPPVMRKQYNFSPSSTRKQYKDPASQRSSSGSTHSIDSLRNESGKGTKRSSLERGAKPWDDGTKRYSSPGIDLLSKYSPTSSRRTPTSGGHRRASSSSGSEMRRRVHPGGGGGERSSSGRGSRRNSGSLKSSSDGAGVKGSSPLALYKEDDPSYIHNNLNLYLDMEVFNMDKGEHFKMVFKSPVMQYGHTTEIPSLVVVSSYKFYIFRITAPERLVVKSCWPKPFLIYTLTSV